MNILTSSFSLNFDKFYLHCASCWDVVWGSCSVGIVSTFLVRCGALHSFGSGAIMWSWFLQTWRLLYVHIWLRGWRLDVVVLAEVSDVIFVRMDVTVYVFWNVVTQTWNMWSVHKNSVKIWWDSRKAWKPQINFTHILFWAWKRLLWVVETKCPSCSDLTC